MNPRRLACRIEVDFRVAGAYGNALYIKARDPQLKKTTWLTLIIAVLVIVVDQTGKYLVATNLPVGGAWSPFSGPNPFFQIVYTYNTGVAFGLFKDLGVVFIIVPLIISGAIVFYARRLQPDQKLVAFALGLMLGGALGNVIDRIRFGGGVLDFFEVGIGSLRNASNFADWSIVAGVIVWAVAMLLEDRRSKQKATPASTAGEVDLSK
jgi:signal peptidase II